jgi:hypothetical protein
MIWIIGEYAERIDNADELLETFLETFPEEPAAVQLQLLTATVKLFLKKPTEARPRACCVALFVGGRAAHRPTGAQGHAAGSRALAVRARRWTCAPTARPCVPHSGPSLAGPRRR